MPWLSFFMESNGPYWFSPIVMNLPFWDISSSFASPHCESLQYRRIVGTRMLHTLSISSSKHSWRSSGIAVLNFALLCIKYRTALGYSFSLTSNSGLLLRWSSRFSKVSSLILLLMLFHRRSRLFSWAAS